ncbi:alpha/beta fold hydrolase [Myxococcota bacterium]|nr:alpha/beta fold hydrolase [Myxococcota bacterium]
MPRAPLGEIELEYDLTGAGEPLLLIMGIGAQLILWHDELVARLAARGFQVLRFDNRDVGKSTWLDHAPVPAPGAVLSRAWLGLPFQAPYTLADMARDVVGLLDHLGWARAHVVGASMGGMIAQHLAFSHPERVATLTSIMSTTGGRWVSVPKPQAMRALVAGRPRTEEEAEAWFLRFSRAVQGPAFPVDEQALGQLARRAFRRGANPAGFARQLAAIMRDGDRTRRLAAIQAPTLVLHGADDPLIPPAGGRATAAAIPGARLRLVEGWGHSLPPGIWDTLVDELGAHAMAHPVRAGAGG